MHAICRKVGWSLALRVPHPTAAARHCLHRGQPSNPRNARRSHDRQSAARGCVLRGGCLPPGRYTPGAASRVPQQAVLASLAGCPKSPFVYPVVARPWRDRMSLALPSHATPRQSRRHQQPTDCRKRSPLHRTAQNGRRLQRVFAMSLSLSAEDPPRSSLACALPGDSTALA